MFPLFGPDTKGDPVFSMCFPPRQNASLVGLHQKNNCTQIIIFVILHPLSGLNEIFRISWFFTQNRYNKRKRCKKNLKT